MVGGLFYGYKMHKVITKCIKLIHVGVRNEGLSINMSRIGNGISYIGFNRSRYEDNSTRLSLVRILLNFYTITHDLLTQINLGLISCDGN